MSGDHSHASAVSSAGRHKRPMVIAFGLTFAYMLVEALGGIVFDSLALLSDAGHMMTDVLGLGMALAAIQFGSSRRSVSHTYGLYRLEVLAALLNAVLLFAVATYVIYEAGQRLQDPPEVPGLPLLLVAGVGFLVNIISFKLLQAGAQESLNVKGAFLEVMADMIGSAGVIVAGIILITTGWAYADPIIGAGIGLFILPRTWRLGKESLMILLEIAPSDVDVDQVQEQLSQCPGVDEVHDLHVWTLTSGLRAATGHLTVRDGADLGSVLTSTTHVLAEQFSIQHVTLQCEPAGFREARPEI